MRAGSNDGLAEAGRIVVYNIIIYQPAVYVVVYNIIIKYSYSVVELVVAGLRAARVRGRASSRLQFQNHIKDVGLGYRVCHDWVFF